jgi:hypothetical protein
MKEWSRLKKVAIISAVTIFGLVGVGAAQNGTQSKPNPTSPTSRHVKSIVTKTETTTVSVPFDTQNIDDATLLSGTTQTKTEGMNGIKTSTWNVTYTDRIETNRTLQKEEITTAPVTKVVLHGTKIAELTCPNGTYVNTDGITVCSPYSAPSVPAGATAQCMDGTYSFSLHHSGTCSHHGGVSTWL